MAHSGDGSSGEGQCCTIDCEAHGGLLDFFGSHNGHLDMCMPDNEDLRRSVTDMKYFDENTWEELDPERVAEGERAELERFKKMGVYDCETRAVAMNDELRKFVKVKWLRTNKGAARIQRRGVVWWHRSWRTVSGWTSCLQERPH